LRRPAGLAARVGFVAGLDLILLVGVVICGAAAVLTFALLHKRGFVAAAVGDTQEEPGEERLAA
jgi:hypothetical protein